MVLGHDIENGERTKDVKITNEVTFDAMLLSPNTLTGLKNSGFLKPSPIQLSAIPLGKCGFDLLLEAKSGTGKTAVFTIIALEKLELEKGLQTIMLAPTREIASQICDVIKAIGQLYEGMRVEVVMGGLSVQDDIAKFKQGPVHILVASPGRLRHLIQDNHIDTSAVRLLVFDEADKLIEKSFQADINYIFASLPKEKQVIMSSATYPEGTKEFIQLYVDSAQHICPDNSCILLGVEQKVTVVEYNSNVVKQTQNKYKELLKIMTSKQFKQCLIFCNYQTRVADIHKLLTRDKWPAEQLYGLQQQTDRLDALRTLQEFKCRILISTDLAARGIDASNVDLVINFEPPHEWATYLHRIGRAGRFGSYGTAITMVSNGNEERKFRTMLNNIHDRVRINYLWTNKQFVSTGNALEKPAKPMVPTVEKVKEPKITNEPSIPLACANLDKSLKECINGKSFKYETYSVMVQNLEDKSVNISPDDQEVIQPLPIYYRNKLFSDSYLALNDVASRWDCVLDVENEIKTKTAYDKQLLEEYKTMLASKADKESKDYNVNSELYSMAPEHVPRESLTASEIDEMMAEHYSAYPESIGYSIDYSTTDSYHTELLNSTFDSTTSELGLETLFDSENDSETLQPKEKYSPEESDVISEMARLGLPTEFGSQRGKRNKRTQVFHSTTTNYKENLYNNQTNKIIAKRTTPTVQAPSAQISGPSNQSKTPVTPNVATKSNGPNNRKSTSVTIDVLKDAYEKLFPCKNVKSYTDNKPDPKVKTAEAVNKLNEECNKIHAKQASNKTQYQSNGFKQAQNKSSHPQSKAVPKVTYNHQTDVVHERCSAPKPILNSDQKAFLNSLMVPPQVHRQMLMKKKEKNAVLNQGHMQETNQRIPTTNRRIPTTYQTPTNNQRVPTTNQRIPTIHRRFPTANERIPTANNWIPTQEYTPESYQQMPVHDRRTTIPNYYNYEIPTMTNQHIPSCNYQTTNYIVNWRNWCQYIQQSHIPNYPPHLSVPFQYNYDDWYRNLKMQTRQVEMQCYLQEMSKMRY